MHRARSAAFVTLLTLVVGAPSIALAQSSTGELTEAPNEHRIAGDLGFFYRREGPADVALVQPSLYGNFTAAHLTNDVFLQIDVAWRMIGIAGTYSGFRAMNPYIGARIGAAGGGRNDQWRARGGIGFTVPLTNAYDDFRVGGAFTLSHGLIAQILAPGMQGAYDAWLTSSLNAAVVLRGDFEYRGEYVIAGADAAFAMLLPVEYSGRTGDTALSVQAGAFVGGRPIPQLAMGLRFQAVALVSTRDTMGMASNTEGFTSLIPFVRGEIGSGFVEGRLLMNLDSPFGFSFDSGTSGAFVHVWSAQISGGGSF